MATMTDHHDDEPLVTTDHDWTVPEIDDFWIAAVALAGFAAALALLGVLM